MSEFNSLSELVVALGQYDKKGIVDSRFIVKDGKLTLKVPTGQAELTDVDGGYTVSGEIIAPIARSLAQKSTLWNKATKYYSSGPGVNTAYIPFLTETSRANASKQFKCYWPAEGTAKTAAKFVFDVKQIKLNKVYALMYITDELYSDAAAFTSVVDNWIGSEQDGSLIWQIERAMLMGDGATSMVGIMSAGSHGTIGVAVPDPVIESTILNYVKALTPASVKTAEWYMSKENYNDILDINWTNDGVMEFRDGNMYLCGMRVNVMEQMVEPYDLMLGDVSQYAIALKSGPLVSSAINLSIKFLTDEKIIRWGIRINGGSFGSKYTLEDGTEVGTFVVPAGSPAEESSSSESSSSSVSSSSSTWVRSSSSSSSKSSLSSDSSSSSSKSTLSSGSTQSASTQSASSDSSQSASTQSASSDSSGSSVSDSSSSISSVSDSSSSDSSQSESSQSESSDSTQSASTDSSESSSQSSGMVGPCKEAYVASTFGTAAINGNYYVGGRYASRAYYVKSGGGKYIFWSSGLNVYAIANTLGASPAQWLSNSVEESGDCPDGSYTTEDGLVS